MGPKKKNRDNAVARRDQQAATRSSTYNQTNILAQAQIQQYVSNALPKPAEIREWEELVPGSGERLLTAFEEQAKHRQRLEDKVVTGNLGRASRGQVFGFILGLVVSGLAAYLIVTGQAELGVVAIALELAALAGIFVFGRQHGAIELARKRAGR